MKQHPIFAVTVALAAMSGAQAAPVLDQSFVPGPLGIQARAGVIGSVVEYKVFQSFSVGISGVLTSVDVYVESNGTPAQNLVLDVVSTADPLGSALASMSIAPSGVPAAGGFLSFDLSAANLAVLAGDLLSIRLSSAQDFTGNVNEYVAIGDSAGGYAGGQGQHWSSLGGFNTPGWDFYFKTWVDDAGGQVPEPSALLLAMVALGAAGAARRHALR